MTARNALLEVPGVGAGAQHLEIVVVLEQQDVEIAQPRPGELAAAAEVGNHAYPPSGAILHHETHRLTGVVGDGKRLDPETAGFERLAGADFVQRGRRATAQLGAAKGPLGGIDRDVVTAAEARRAAHVVFVLVGQHHGIEAVGIEPHLLHPPFQFATGKPGIHQQLSPGRLDHHGVAAATGSQDANPKRRAVEGEAELHAKRVSRGCRAEPLCSVPKCSADARCTRFME